MRTTGSTIIVPTRGSGGLYYDINQLDLQIAQMPEMDLWVDGKSIVSRSPLVGASRTNGGSLLSASPSTSPTFFESTVDFDGPGFVFDRTAFQEILAPDYVIGQNYAFFSVMSFVNGIGGVNGIVGHTDSAGNRVRFWGAQVAPGDPFSLSINHATSGASATIAAGSSGIIAGTRYIIWATYNAVTNHVAIGRGNTYLGGGTIATLPKTQASIGVGSTGLGSSQALSGRIDAFIAAPTSLYSPYVDHAANRLRADMIALIAERYNVAA